MIKIPTFVHYKKRQRHILRNFKLKILKQNNNSVKLLSLQKGYITVHQIMSLRILFRKMYKRKIRIFIPLLVNYHKTYKGVGMRMGKGKGKGKEWYIGVSKGSILMEFIIAKRSLFSVFRSVRYFSKKLPLKTLVKFYEKDIQEEYKFN